MAITELTGTFSGISTTPASDLRIMLATQFAALGGNWSVIDNGVVNGTSIRSVIKNKAGFCLMMVTSTTITDAGFDMYLGQGYYLGLRSYTVTAASSTGSSNPYTYTYTTSGTHDLVVGETITISGASNGNYNRVNALITAVTSNTFSLSNTVSGGSTTFTSGLVITNPAGTISNAVGNGSSVTYTYSSSYYDFKTGDNVIIGNITAPELNVTGIVTSFTSNTVTIANTSTATYISGGTIVYKSSTVIPSGSLINIGFGTGAVSNTYGFSGLNYIPTASYSSFNNTPSVHLTWPYTATVGQTSWNIIYESNYAIVGIKDGTTTLGKWFYFGAAESLVANPTLNDYSNFTLVQNWWNGNVTAIILNSIGNNSVNVSHQGSIVLESNPVLIGAPGTNTYRDKYSSDPTKTTASNILICRNANDIKSATDPSTYGWKRFRLNGIVYSDYTGSAYGDTTIIGSSTYRYLGGTGKEINAVVPAISGWARIN